MTLSHHDYHIHAKQIYGTFLDLRSGEAAVKITVLKDGHQFVVHVIDPKEDPFAVEEPIIDESSSTATETQSGSEKEKAEVESSEKEGK